MSNIGTQDDELFEGDLLESLADLERNKCDAVKRARASTRTQVRSKVIAQPGNSGDRLKFKIQGVTGDISSGGCQVLFPIPLRVGDIYWLTFDKTQLNLDSVFARCLRCRLIREDAYETGLKFYEAIDVVDAVEDVAVEKFFSTSKSESLFG